ncbi:MAG: Gfo/Idh/MocA family oxidoreductase [Planctomycetota bacterium]
MIKTISRRSFLKKAALVSAAVSAPALVPSSALGMGIKAAPGQRITLGFIGVGGMGSAHLHELKDRSDIEILAVCDVDERCRDAARETIGSGCAAYKDYRELLDCADIDAVVIATPDHWHTLTAIHACQAGKDVYCEKPLTLTIEEALALKTAVHRYGRVLQTGSQQRSSPEFRRACEIVRSGRIGKVDVAYVGIGTGPVGEWQADCDPPSALDWDLWLGPAPRVPFNPARHPYSFRWFYDYSGGKMTDWGAHHNDIVQWGFGMDGSGPVFLEGKASFPMRGLYETAVEFEVTYEYADGRRAVCSNRGHGVRFVGTKGWVHVDRGFLQTEPEYLKDEPLGPGDVHLFNSPGHHQNWLDCIRTREMPICNVEIGAGSVILCHLCNIALRTGRKLYWDPARNRFDHDEEANRWVSKPYCSPWHL